jgi:hypothetical protein
MLDALIVPYNKLKRRMDIVQTIMERTAGEVKPVAMQITPPFKQRGTVNVAVIFELSDGQTITIFFHNPDTTPQRLAPTDELISWKWLLNKKDVTIVVAPERGKDLNVREVARRILRLAAKNSAAFQRANARRAERLQEVQKLKDEISGLEKALFSAEFTIATLELELEEAKEKQKKGLAKAPGVPTKANGGEVKKAKDPNTDPNTEIAGVTPPAQEEKPVEPTEPEAQAAPVQEATENRAWANADVDPAGGAKVIGMWDTEKADALLAKTKVELVGNAPEFIARTFIADYLQGRVVKTKIGDCVINSMSKGKLPLAANRKGSLKMEAIARIPEILIDGNAGKMEKLKKKRNDNIDGFYPFTHLLRLEDKEVSVKVKVGHRGVDGLPLVYNLDEPHVMFDSVNGEWLQTNLPSCTLSPAWNGASPEAIDNSIGQDSPEVKSTMLDAANAEEEESCELNITILAVWDKDGNRMPELEDTPEGEGGGKADVTYVNSADGLFTSFYPNTPAGEEAWKVINATPGAENGKVLSAHAESTIAQLRKAGYTVEEGASTPSDAKEDDALLNELREKPEAPEFDPLTPDGYAKVQGDEALQLDWQDRLDAFFQERIVAVRNALRALGWKGRDPSDARLYKEEAEAQPTFKHVGAGNNIVGWAMNDISDDLTKTPEEYAAYVDAKAMAEVNSKEQKSDLATNPLIGKVLGVDLGLDDEKYVAEVVATFIISGWEGKPVPWVAGIIHKKFSDDVDRYTPVAGPIYPTGKGEQRFDKREIGVAYDTREEAVAHIDNWISKWTKNGNIIPAASDVATEDPQKAADRALFQSVIDKTITTEDGEGILSPLLYNLLEPAYQRNADDPEMMALFEEAANSYTEAALAATANIA